MATSTPPRLGHVLVVGGCGFLGHHIVSQLLAIPSTTVSVADLHTTRNRNEKATYHTADITSATSVRTVLDACKPDVIIHTASPVAVSTNSNEFYERVNIQGTQTLLDCAAECKSVKALVFTSSASVVHDTVSDLVRADERWPVLRTPLQREYYSATKGIAENAVLAANKPGTLLTAAIRPSSIFGEGDVQLVPGLYKAFQLNQTGFQLGDNDNLFDFTYVGNVAHAHILAAQALMATAGMATAPLDHERVDGEAFFITNDAPVYFWDFARQIWKLAGDTRTPQKNVWVIPTWFGLPLATFIEWLFLILFWGYKKPNLTRKIVNYSCMTRTFNIDKARQRLGYEPLVGLEEGVKKTMEWLGKEVGGLGRDAAKNKGVEKKTQ